MTDLLSKAFKKASELPKESQDNIAKRLLDEIEDELKWQNSFENSVSKLKVLADKALAEHEDGKTLKISFDEL
jgi:hypothetical protein